MNVHEVVTQLIGPIETVGETNTDEKRFENLKVMAELVNTLLSEIESISMDMNLPEHSRSRSGKYAAKFLFTTKMNIG